MQNGRVEPGRFHILDRMPLLLENRRLLLGDVIYRRTGGTDRPADVAAHAPNGIGAARDRHDGCEGDDGCGGATGHETSPWTELRM